MRSAAVRGVWVFALLANGAACSLFVDLSGLSSSDVGSKDAESDVVGDAGAVGDGSKNDASDASTNIGTDASWSFAGTNGLTASTVTLNNVQAGDLVIIGCDMPSSGSAVSFTGFSASVLSPQTVEPPAPNSLQTVIAWGVIGEAPDGGSFSMTAQPSNSVSFIDCTINNYRGGSAKPTLLGSKTNGGTGAGLVTCGPVDSLRGGVGYYIAVRYTCAGLPSSPFLQRQDLEGNPNGDFAPTDGNTLQTQLADCNSSTGDWVCTTISISP